MSFVGKKVAAMVIAKDQDLQISAEEALAAALAERGVNAVASYRLLPRELLGNKDATKSFFERASVEGVVALRLVGVDKEVAYTPDMWSTPYYGSFWGYYGYGWSSTVVFGDVPVDTIVTIETLVFSVPLDKLLWAGISEKTNPAGARKLAHELVKEGVKEMTKQGLVQKQ
jgi:hypothetical protein